MDVEDLEQVIRSPQLPSSSGQIVGDPLSTLKRYLEHPKYFARLVQPMAQGRGAPFRPEEL